MATMLSREPAPRRLAPATRGAGLSDPRPHVVILGGGFAGLSAARALRTAPVRVTLIDKRNYHLFQPLLYQVATASLSPAEIAYPIRAILRRQRNATVLLAEATGIDPDRQEVRLADGRLSYDYLIVAIGSQGTYFGHDDWEPLAPGLKSMEEALAIRRKVFRAFELAEREPDPDLRRALLTFVVVGGGATGVELAGALAEIARQTLRDEFRTFHPADARILLVEGGPTLLKGYPERLTMAARRSLEGLGVEVRTGTRVLAIARGRVTLPDGVIAAETVLWAAGVTGHALGSDLGADPARGGRVPVTPTLQIPDHPNVLVVGDLAASVGRDGDDLPGVAQVALQGGRQAGTNVARLVAGREPEPFRYRDKGTMATIGWNRAVAQIGPLQLSGFVAWAIWALIHIAYLITYRSRAAVMLHWSWAYVTRNRASRLIIGTPVATAAAEREPIHAEAA